MAVRNKDYLSRRRYALVRNMVFMLVLLVFGFLVKFLFPIGLDYVGIYLESLHSYIARPSNPYPSLASCSWFCGLRYQISKQNRGSVLDFVDLERVSVNKIGEVFLILFT